MNELLSKGFFMKRKESQYIVNIIFIVLHDK